MLKNLKLFTYQISVITQLEEKISTSLKNRRNEIKSEGNKLQTRQQIYPGNEFNESHKLTSILHIDNSTILMGPLLLNAFSVPELLFSSKSSQLMQI